VSKDYLETIITLSNQGVVNIADRLGGYKTCLNGFGVKFFSFAKSIERYNSKILKIEGYSISRSIMKAHNKEVWFASYVAKQSINNVGLLLLEKTTIFSTAQIKKLMIDDKTKPSGPDKTRTTKFNNGSFVEIPLSFRFLDLMVHSDGSVSIVGENYSEQNSGAQSFDVFYTHDDLHFFTLDASGEIKHIRNKTNTYSSKNGHLCKIGHFSIDDQFQIIYRHQKSKDMMLASYNKEGKVETVSLNEIQNGKSSKKFYFRTDAYQLLSEKELLIPTITILKLGPKLDGHLKMAKLSFN